MKKEDTTLSKSERRRVESLRNEIIGFISEPHLQSSLFYDDDDEEYDDYNTDDSSPVDEEPIHDTRGREEYLYHLYRNAILRNMN